MFRHARGLLIAVTVFLALAAPAAAGGKKIVVELFTSQGCSSCPPADAYLAELARRDDVIALSFHIDYWNYIGWTDPFSTPEATARQRAYSRALGKAYVYTPQIVIDGRAQTVGSDRDAIINLIRMAAAAPKLDIEVSHGKDGTVRINLPAGDAQNADIWIGFYDDTHSTEIGAGENNGQRIVNTNVIRSFRRIGRWSGEPFDRRYDLAKLGASGRDGCVIMVQGKDNGPVLGAASFPLPQPGS